ncbi:hypothetical protein [Piscinibacter terrae]|uniref:Uncharacterized protein n=1 Tax=Piscinibacter terrae TaxID=2496871 RepID=A0A3N7IQZ9_9BURK|nr:hypothetical protein [Albitalea terrae]RQP21312.1 hypothetical protein DZC73_27820 [Albitalea terrae]
MTQTDPVTGQAVVTPDGTNLNLIANPATWFGTLWASIVHSGADGARQQLKDKLGKAVDPQWIDKLTDQQALDLLDTLNKNPESVPVLIQAGMKADDVIALSPRVSAAEAKDPAFVKALKERLDWSGSPVEAIEWARTAMVAPDALYDPAFAADVANTANGSTPEARFAVAREHLLERELGVDEKYVKGLPPDQVVRLLGGDKDALKSVFTALQKDFGGNDNALLSELSALTPDQLRIMGTRDPAGVVLLHKAGQNLASIAAMDTPKFEDLVHHAHAQALFDQLKAANPSAEPFITLAQLQELDDATIQKLLKASPASLNKGFAFLASMVQQGFSGSIKDQLTALSKLSDKDLDALIPDAFATLGGAPLPDGVSVPALMNRGLSLQDAVALLSAVKAGHLDPAKLKDDAFFTDLKKVDRAVVQTLVDAGVTRGDALVYAGSITADEAANPNFMAVLKAQLAKKTPADEAIQWARTAALAGPDVLADTTFAADVADKANGDTLAARFDAARAHLLARNLGLDAKYTTGLSSAQVNKLLSADKGSAGALFTHLQKDFAGSESALLAEMSELAPDQMAALVNVDPAQVMALHNASFKLADIANVKPEDMAALLAAVGTLTPEQRNVVAGLVGKGVQAMDAVTLARGGATQANVDDADYIAKAKLGHAADIEKLLLAAGMKPDEAARAAGGVTLAEIEDPKFQAELQRRLAGGTSGEEAIQWARTAMVATPEELASPAFVADVANPANGATVEQRFDAARRHLLAQRLGVVLGPDEHEVGDRNPQQITNLLAFDPATLKSVWDKLHGGIDVMANPGDKPLLNDLAKLSPEQLDALNSMDPAKVIAIHKKLGVDINEIATLAPTDFNSLSTLATSATAPVIDNDIATVQSKDVTDIKHYNVAGGLYTYTVNGQVHVVRNATNPSLYGNIAAKAAADAKDKVNQVRAAHGLPPLSDVSPLTQDGTRWKDPNDHSKGKYSIEDQAFIDMIDEYRQGVKDNKYSKDSPQAKLVRYFDYKVALSQGYQLIPYTEEPSLFGTVRTYPNGKPEAEPISPATMHAIFSEGKVNKEFQALLGDKDVSADLQKRTKDLLATLPPGVRDAMANKLHDSLTSEEYTAAIQELRDAGLNDQAEQMLQRDLASLTMLDPALAQDAGQQVLINANEADFQNLMDHPERIDPNAIKLATKDSIEVLIQSLRSGSGITRHLSQSQLNFISYLEKFEQSGANVNDLSLVIKKLMVGGKDLSAMTDADLEKAMDGVVSGDQRGKITEFFHETQKMGVWGTIAGGAALASFGYKVGKNGAFGPNSTPLERWGAARDLISFLSVSGHMSKSFASFVDWMRKLDSKDAGSTWKFLGLDRTLPEVWGKSSFLPGGKTWPGGGGLPSELLDTAFDGLRTLTDVPLGAALTADDMVAVGNLMSHFDTSVVKPLGSVAQRIGVSVLKVFGTVTDFASIADIVLGGMGIDKGIKDHDGIAIAGGTLQVTSGLLGTGAAIIGTLELFGSVGVFAGLAGPLFLGAAVVGLLAFGFVEIANSIKQANEWHALTDEQGAFFAQAHDDGVAVDDWGDRLEFLRYAYSHYGHEDTDPSLNYFDAQADEWAYFQATPGSGGSSNNRLNRGLHHSNDKTKQPPVSDDSPPLAG